MKNGIRHMYETSMIKRNCPEIALDNIPMWIYNLSLLQRTDPRLFTNFCRAVKTEKSISDICLHPNTLKITELFRNSENLGMLLEACDQDELKSREFLRDFGFLDSFLELKDIWRRFIMHATYISVAEHDVETMRLRTLSEILGITVLENSIR